MRILLWTLILLGLPMLWAQGTADTKDDKKVKKPRPHYWVLVTLKQGTEVEGVALNSRFIEKSVYGRYKEIGNYRLPGAGIRVWYIDHTRGFTFIPYIQVKRMKRKRLKPKEFRKIIELVRKKSAKAKKQNRDIPQLPELPPLVEKEERQRTKSPGQQQPPSREQILSSLPQDVRDFVDRFPPQEGWGPKIFRRLNPRFPNRLTPVQRTFVVGFRRWGKVLRPLFSEDEFDEEPPNERQ